MHRVGQKLVKDKRSALAATAGIEGGENTLKGRDLLSVLSELGDKPTGYCHRSATKTSCSIVKANMEADIKDSERLSDEEFIGREFTV